jgi:S-adenosylhomocysteine hydrolase
MDKSTWDYPLLKAVVEAYKRINLNDVLLLACQHLLGPQVAMFQKLWWIGVKQENCILAGKPYSTSIEAYDELKQIGCCTLAPWQQKFAWAQPFDSWFTAMLDGFVAKSLANLDLSRYRKIVILDDGGFMHTVCKPLLAQCKNVAGVEQTSSGHTRIQALQLPFPVTSVARSWHKLVCESPHIAELSCERIKEHIAFRHMDNPRILVCGLGAIGRQVATQLAFLHNLDAYACDSALERVADHGNVQALRNKCRVLPFDQAFDRISEFEVIIGASGNNLFDETFVERLHPAVSLISVSSSDREFPARYFRQSKLGGIHDDCYRGRRCLVNCGFPITFYGNYHEAEPRNIELTIACLMASVLASVTDNGPQLPIVINRIYEMWNAETQKGKKQ